MASGSQQRQIQVLLTLHDGERSFGMSLAQKSPALGPKYTVVSSVFANSPADRAGIRKGYVVRCINDKPVGGLTVAQVANHFRNVGQAKITLDVVESIVSPRTSAFAAAATFGGVATLPNRPATQAGAGSGSVPVTGFSAVSSGRAIAAPGSALAAPRVAAPKQPILRLGTKLAAKTLGLQPQSGVVSSASATVVSADAKTVSSANCKSKSVEPVLRLGPKPKSVESGKAEEKVTATITSVDSKPASKRAQDKPSSAPSASRRIPQSPVEAIDNCRGVASAQMTGAVQPESSPAPMPTPPLVKPTTPTSAPSPSVAAKKLISAPASQELTGNNTTLQPPLISTVAPTNSSHRAAATAAAPEAAQPHTTTKTGKKRGRRRKNAAPANGTTSSKGKGKGKAKKTSKHHHENNEMDDMLDDDEVLEYYVSSSDSDLEESPSTKTKRRTGKGRRRGVTDRSRHSLTIDRLLGMGFTQEDAEASVKEVGNDPDECMLWIISKIEERQFTEDLNQASIQSEQSKRDEEKRVKKKEKETIAHAEKFMALFPTSYMICSESTASNLKNFLQSTIDQVDGEAYIREVFSKLLSLEGKSIRWYKEASRSYMLELAGRLDTELGAHDVSECCARVSANDANSPDGSCAFIRKVLEEVKALTTALFEMPTNQGGVPPVFLECDETTKFDLEDDGFEVIELNE
ncbi:hypothetical protein PC116_g6364 [Phytophthora cactorum]|nr:hypothetical protein Pcac1_g9716 [Phytophthora cactorum]KAG2838297.1 hypothetical protein PC111_g4287 [Phytophthora cactorum]KAG2840494.1 hypothetical protein PC112_g3708 [Phytophthora cactorum]KAG2925520.1 hypothetical protein PC114_g4067 [Phytophthora cactorum]KAG4245849.1 hypothetical protein PC116_g6364 [Phytophthora cactorum]